MNHAWRWARERGSELIEFAIVLPLLLLLIAGIVDFGLLFQRYEVVTNAAREGARVGVLPDYSFADVPGRVADYISAGGLSGTANTTVESVTIPAPGGTTVPGIRVTVTYPHSFVFLSPVAGLLGRSFGSITLTAVSTMRLEPTGG